MGHEFESRYRLFSYTRDSKPQKACKAHAVIAQLVERRLPKPNVAGSSPVYRSSSTSQTSHNLHNLQLSKAVGFFLLSVGKLLQLKGDSVDKMKSKQVGYAVNSETTYPSTAKDSPSGMSLFLLYTICQCIDRGSCVLRRVFPMCCAQSIVPIVYDGVKL